MIFLLLLHFIALPIAIIATLVNGLGAIAAVDTIVFILMFAVEYLVYGESIRARGGLFVSEDDNEHSRTDVAPRVRQRPVKA